MRTNLSQVLLAAALVAIHYNRVGVAQWCNVNRSEKTIQCNYETEAACESYLGNGEFCRSNPFFVLPPTPKAGSLKDHDRLREPKHVPPKVK